MINKSVKLFLVIILEITIVCITAGLCIRELTDIIIPNIWIFSVVATAILIPIMSYNLIYIFFGAKYADYSLNEAVSESVFKKFTKKYFGHLVWAFGASLLIYLANVVSLTMMISFSEDKYLPIAIVNAVYLIVIISFVLINGFRSLASRAVTISGLTFNQKISDDIYRNIKDELIKFGLDDKQFVFTFEKSADIYIIKEKNIYYVIVGTMALQLFSREEFNAYALHEIIRYDESAGKYSKGISFMVSIIQVISCPKLYRFDIIHVPSSIYVKNNFDEYNKSDYFYRGLASALTLKELGYEQAVLNFYAKYTIMRLSNYFVYNEDKYIELNRDIGTTLVDACETFYNKNKSFIRYCLINADPEPFEYDLFYQIVAELYDNYELQVDFSSRAYPEYSKRISKEFESPDYESEIADYKSECERTIEDCEEALKDDKVSLDTLLELSTRTIKLFLYKFTLKLCDVILEKDPKCYRALLQKGKLLLRYENDATGLEYLNRIPTNAILGSEAIFEARRYCAIIGDSVRKEEYQKKIVENITHLSELKDALTIKKNDILELASTDDEGVNGVIEIAKASPSVFALTCGVKTVGEASIIFVVLYFYNRVDDETAHKVERKVFHFLDSLQGQYNLEIRPYEYFQMFISDRDCVVLQKEEEID